jgi:hypothetical protein
MTPEETFRECKTMLFNQAKKIDNALYMEVSAKLNKVTWPPEFDVEGEKNQYLVNITGFRDIEDDEEADEGAKVPPAGLDPVSKRCWLLTLLPLQTLLAWVA